MTEEEYDLYCEMIERLDERPEQRATLFSFYDEVAEALDAEEVYPWASE